MAYGNGLGSSCSFKISGVEQLRNGKQWGFDIAENNEKVMTWASGDWQKSVPISKSATFNANLLIDSTEQEAVVGEEGAFVGTIFSGKTIACQARIIRLNGEVPYEGIPMINVTFEAQGTVTALPSGSPSQGDI